MTGFNPSKFVRLPQRQVATEVAVKEFKAFFSRGKDVHRHGKAPVDVIDHTAVLMSSIRREKSGSISRTMRPKRHRQRSKAVAERTRLIHPDTR